MPETIRKSGTGDEEKCTCCGNKFSGKGDFCGECGARRCSRCGDTVAEDAKPEVEGIQGAVKWNSPRDGLKYFCNLGCAEAYLH